MERSGSTQVIYMYQNVWGFSILLANSINPDQTARMRNLIWVSAGHICNMIVSVRITKTCLFKYIENFTTKN